MRRLSAGVYTPAQVDGALKGAIGLDTQLVDDGTYLVIEVERAVVAAGGWSYRQTLFGNDAQAARSDAEIDPATGAARIRAFFVDPAYARRGFGSQLLCACESAAAARGYRRLELMSTLPGLPLYERHGFVAGAAVAHELGDGLTITFVPLHKAI